MKEFLSDDFLLSTATAKRLYHEVAAPRPIIDYHNHLPPMDIAEDRNHANLYEAWLEGDHYKWRAMRSAGVGERYCTGDASAKEKFDAWAATVPYTLGNPLYHWTHLELRRYFGITELLSPDSAEEIWNKANAKLADPAYSARGLLKKMNVKIVCTTDDPADNLAHHKAHQTKGSPDVKMLPTFRPDKAHNFSNLKTWTSYMEKLGDSAGTSITCWDDILEVLLFRHSYFHESGCRVSDHGVEFVPGLEWTPEQANAVMKKAFMGERPSEDEILLFRSAVMESCGRMDAAAGWVMQIHMGALRNVNPRALAELGPDTGFDVIGDFPQASGLASHLGNLVEDGMLPKTILYSLNPGDNDVLASIIGGFQGEVPGKVQFGSGWWFNDQKDGMVAQLNSLSNMGLLSRFIGMLTDSRSFLSYPRHEYFRRILCNLFGNDVENGELPNDIELIGRTVADISYDNALNYFGISLEQ